MKDVTASSSMFAINYLELNIFLQLLELSILYLFQPKYQ
jgi:hypothetical protein